MTPGVVIITTESSATPGEGARQNFISMHGQHETSPRRVTCRSVPSKRPHYSFGPVFVTRRASATTKNRAGRNSRGMQGVVPRDLIHSLRQAQTVGRAIGAENVRGDGCLFILPLMVERTYSRQNLNLPLSCINVKNHFSYSIRNSYILYNMYVRARMYYMYY